MSDVVKSSCCSRSPDGTGRSFAIFFFAAPGHKANFAYFTSEWLGNRLITSTLHDVPVALCSSLTPPPSCLPLTAFQSRPRGKQRDHANTAGIRFDRQVDASEKLSWFSTCLASPILQDKSTGEEEKVTSREPLASLGRAIPADN